MRAPAEVPVGRHAVRTRGRRALSWAAAGAVVAALAAPSVATAAPAFRNYSTTRTHWSSTLGACFNVIVSGRIRYDKIDLPAPFSWEFKNPLLENPSITTFFRSACGNTTPVSMNQVSMSQGWYENRCNVIPSIGAGIPWSVQVQVTIDCGSESLGVRSTTSNATGSSYTQSNSGSPVSWRVTRDNVSSICVAGKVSVTAHRGTRSDSFTFTDMKACGT